MRDTAELHQAERRSIAPPASSINLSWSDARLLGFKPMDDAHEDFYRVANALLCCTADSVISAIDDFQAHAQEHFDQEDDWMRSTAFPPRDCHLDEHEIGRAHV